MVFIDMVRRMSKLNICSISYAAYDIHEKLLEHYTTMSKIECRKKQVPIIQRVSAFSLEDKKMFILYPAVNLSSDDKMSKIFKFRLLETTHRIEFLD
jgi:hypothetical protein